MKLTRIGAGSRLRLPPSCLLRLVVCTLRHRQLEELGKHHQLGERLQLEERLGRPS